MRLSIPLIGMLLGSCAAMAADQPLVEITIPDAVRTRTRLAACPYGALWALPALDSVRSVASDWLAGAAETPTIPYLALLNDVTQAALQAQAGPGHDVVVQAALQLPTQAGRFFELASVRSPPDAHGVVTVDGIGMRHHAEWILLGAGAEPAAMALPIAQGIETDVQLHMDAAGLAGHLDANAARTLAASALSSLSADLRIIATGTTSRIMLNGFQSPLVTIDAAAISSVPKDSLVVAAAGLDGPGLLALLDKVGGTIPGFQDARSELERLMAAAGMPSLPAVVGSLNGTAWFAATNAFPFPAATVAIPASPEVDAVMTALAKFPWFKADIAAARTQAVPMPLPAGIPVLVQLRRTASHWVATSDLLVMDQLAANQPGGFVLPASASAAAVRALYVQDNQSIAHLMSSYLPLVRASFPQAGTKAMAPVFAAVQRLLGAATPYLKASSAGLTQSADGALIMGENLEMILVPLSLLGAYSIPVVIQSHDLARRKQTSTRIQALLAGLHTADGVPPGTLAALAANAQLPADQLVSPDDPLAPLPHFRYARPAPHPAANQPVVVENPVCNHGRGAVIGFGDGHTAWLRAPKAQHLWDEAARLAVLPQTLSDGLTLADWSAIFADLDLPPAPK